MPGVPAFVLAGPWWALFLFLTGVVFFRTQATYWLARWARGGTDALVERSPVDGRRARFARRMSGPRMERARLFMERKGLVAIPLSVLVIGLQTMVSAAAGYARMRFDLYTAAMIPGCLMWAAMYTAIGLSLWEMWLRSPWLLVGALAAVVALSFALNRWRRTRRRSSSEPKPLAESVAG